MQRAPSTNAMLRTTIAPTMLEGSIKENVLPMRARGVVNFRLLQGMSSDEAIRRVEAIVAPSLVLGATDTRHFIAISDNVFRFLPARLGREDLKRYHGVNERVSVDNYGEFVRFYMRYLREAAG